MKNVAHQYPVLQVVNSGYLQFNQAIHPSVSRLILSNHFSKPSIWIL